jgi:hypothetical protein
LEALAAEPEIMAALQTGQQIVIQNIVEPGQSTLQAP